MATTMLNEPASTLGHPPAVRHMEGPTSPGTPVRYTVATLVNDMDQYEAMRTSLQAGGFTSDDCDYLIIDNTRHQHACAYTGLNALLGAARGDFVILCHQDIRLFKDGRAELDIRLDELSATDPRWALAGNAGGIRPGELAIRITDPHGANQKVGALPQRVQTLDENFIVVRKSARIGFSHDLSGFHLYGADICLHADMAGLNAYVVDFHLAHLSAGKKDASFEDMAERFRAAWEHKLRSRWLQTTCTLVRISGGTLSQVAGRWIEAPVATLSRRLPGAKGWKSNGGTGAG